MSMLAFLAALPRFAAEDMARDPSRGFVGLSMPLPKNDSLAHPLDRKRDTILVVSDCESCTLRRTDIKGFVARQGERGTLRFTSDRGTVRKRLKGRYPPSQLVLFSPWPHGLPLEIGAFAPVRVEVVDGRIEAVHA